MKESLNNARESIDTFHCRWYEESCSLGLKVNVQPSMQRTTICQTQRTNTPAATPLEYYKCALSIPLLDHLLSELDSRFNDTRERVIKFMSLMPSTMLTKECSDIQEDLKEMVSLYSDNLPCESTLATELHCWRVKWEQDRNDSEKCNTIMKALAAADKDMFSNIHVLLKIAATQPVTSCECERSISKLRLVKSVRRSTMTEDRLNGLTLLSVHRDFNLDLDSLLDKFARMYP